MSIAYLAAALLLTCAFGSQLAAQQEKDPRKLLETALEPITTLRRDGSPPFRLEAHFRYSDAADQPQEGFYRLLWISPKENGDELFSFGYRKTRITVSGRTWTHQSRPGIPLRHYQFADALGSLYHALLRVDPKTKAAERFRLVKHPSPNRRCLRGTSFDQRTWCIDVASGRVAEVTDAYWAVEYSDYITFGEGALPGRLRVLERATSNPVLEATLVMHRLEPEGSIRDLMALPEDAESKPHCPPDSLPTAFSKLLKSVEPIYPEEDRRQRREGAVVIFTSIGSDGSIHLPSVVHSPGPRMTQAALDAVRQWQYRPYENCGVPVEAVTYIIVNFKLQR